MNIKRLSLFCATASLLVMSICTSKLIEGEFLLKGAISGVDNESICLNYTEVKDFAFIENSKFEFEGQLTAPSSHSVLFMDSVSQDESEELEPIYQSIMGEASSLMDSAQYCEDVEKRYDLIEKIEVYNQRY